MYQTGYKGIQNIVLNKLFVSGICNFWFIEKEKIASFPRIDPATQFLAGEPALIAGAAWYGPVIVPDSALGYDEKMSISAPGISYNQKVSGFYPGDDTTTRINQENLPYYQYVIVAKMRAGKLYIILGDDKKGADYLADYTSGISVNDTAGAKITFGINSIKKALILPEFLGNNVLPPLSITHRAILSETGFEFKTEDGKTILVE